MTPPPKPVGECGANTVQSMIASTAKVLDASTPALSPFRIAPACDVADSSMEQEVQHLDEISADLREEVDAAAGAMGDDVFLTVGGGLGGVTELNDPGAVVAGDNRRSIQDGVSEPCSVSVEEGSAVSEEDSELDGMYDETEDEAEEGDDRGVEGKGEYYDSSEGPVKCTAQSPNEAKGMDTPNTLQLEDSGDGQSNPGDGQSASEDGALETKPGIEMDRSLVGKAEQEPDAELNPETTISSSTGDTTESGVTGLSAMAPTAAANFGSFFAGSGFGGGFWGAASGGASEAHPTTKDADAAVVPPSSSPPLGQARLEIDRESAKKDQGNDQINENTEVASSKKPQEDQQMDTQYVIEKFMDQMSRLQEEHDSELRAREIQHQNQLEALREEITNQKGQEKHKVVASHDKCLAQMRKLEEGYEQKLRIKDEEMSEVMRKNEGMGLKMDAMKRELEGTKTMVDSHDEKTRQLVADHVMSVQIIESKLSAAQDDVVAKSKEIRDLKDALAQAQTGAGSVEEAYSTLKARVKVVATELKERRIECRTLSASVTDLTEAKSSLETQVTNLQSQLSQHDLSHTEKDEEIIRLNATVKELRSEIQGMQKTVKQRSAVGDKALSAYKKKAQTSLAAANARVASANQAREEAELEASAARTSAEDGQERARQAEDEKNAAVTEAKGKAEELKRELERQTSECSKAKESLDIAMSQLSAAESEIRESGVARANLIEEIAKLGHELKAEREKNVELVHELREKKDKCQQLGDEMEALREDLQRSAAAAFMERQRQDASTTDVAGLSMNGESAEKRAEKGRGDNSDAEATIIILQQELHGANEAIKELKDALRGVLLQKQDTGATAGINNFISVPVTDNRVAKPSMLAPAGSFDSEGTAEDAFNVNFSAADMPSKASSRDDTGNDTTPLYFALEKQAELKTARDEINRLANLLGDAESEKMEAYEAMDEMRKNMEEAEARLRRFEKLGAAAANRNAAAQAHMTSDHLVRGSSGGFGSYHLGGSRALGSSSDNGTSAATRADGETNLEYLKNVMLRYLNAKTLGERKGLIPVLSAVLELTVDEQEQALRSVEDSAGLQGVSATFFESFIK
uniref:GRIP domain-containing protein n=1 Tax=Odontella aurita TaxID=265563 RepID=A0A7S4J5E0_9STRA